MAATPSDTPPITNSLLEWLKANVASCFNAVTSLGKESSNDPETEPYRSLYAAREHLTVIKDKLESHEACPVSVQESHGFASLSAHLLLLFGLNYIQTEEIGRGQQCFEEIVDKYSNDSLAQYPLLDSLNQLGILWANRGEHDKALELLLHAEKIHNDSKGKYPPLATEDIFLGIIREDSLRERSFDNLHTHTLFYLAQVYGQLGQPKLSAEYCQSTLSRQIETNQYDPIEWSLNAATISQYYIGVGNFPQARHCLASARVVLSRIELEDVPATMMEKVEQTRADFSRCWIKYCVVLLDTSIKNRNGDGKDQRNENEPLHRFEPLEVGEFEDEVECELIDNFDSAKNVFLFGQKHVELSKAYFTMDNLASDHASIIQDHSRLFKLLSLFESDLSVKCRISKRRIDALTAVVSEFNPQHFLPLIREIDYELAEIYRDMVDMKIVLASEETTPPTPHAVKKINALVTNAVGHFQKFVDSFEEPIGTVHLRSYLLALLNIARLHTKRIYLSCGEEVDSVRKSLNVYERIVGFKVKCGEEIENVFHEEMKICEEMVELLPMKLSKLLS